MKSIPSSFLPRLLSTLILWGIIITTVLMRSDNGYCLLIGAAALGSLWEYFWLLKIGHLPRHWRIGYIASIILLFGNFWLLRNPRFSAPLISGGGAIFAFDTLVLTITLLVLFFREFIRAQPDRAAAEGIAFTLFGVIYIPWLFSFVAKIIYLIPLSTDGIMTGQYYVLFLLVMTKFSDVGAFVCGSLFGKHLFCPNISPKKTWEGFIGALLFAVTSGALFFALFQNHLPLFSWPLALFSSLFFGFVAIGGDLAESLLKRALHTKDSSHTLPGIGGGLDLIDSVLFTAPLFYFLLQLLFVFKK